MEPSGANVNSKLALWLRSSTYVVIVGKTLTLVTLDEYFQSPNINKVIQVEFGIKKYTS